MQFWKSLWSRFRKLDNERSSEGFNQEAYARSERALTDAQQRAYESVVWDFAEERRIETVIGDL